MSLLYTAGREYGNGYPVLVFLGQATKQPRQTRRTTHDEVGLLEETLTDLFVFHN